MYYPFADSVLNFVRFGGAEGFFHSVMSVVENYPPCVLNVLMNHIGTHDPERAITRLAGDRPDGYSRDWQHEHNLLSEDNYIKGVSMMKMASLIQYTLPGVPSLYYGDEAGMQGMKDPFNRACFPWEDINEELHKWYKRLGEIRNGCAAFKDGMFVPVYSALNVIAYKRVSDNNQVLIAVNNSAETADVPVGTEWDNSYNLFDSVSKDGYIRLGPYAYTLLSK